MRNRILVSMYRNNFSPFFAAVFIRRNKIISNVSKTMRKEELMSRLGSLNKLDIRLIEPVTRLTSQGTRREIDKFAGTDAVSVVLIKERR